MMHPGSAAFIWSTKHWQEMAWQICWLSTIALRYSSAFTLLPLNTVQLLILPFILFCTYDLTVDQWGVPMPLLIWLGLWFKICSNRTTCNESIIVTDWSIHQSTDRCFDVLHNNLYLLQALFQLHTLIFGLDVLGNPVSVVRGVVSGAIDLFYEPIKVWLGILLPLPIQADTICPLYLCVCAGKCPWAWRVLWRVGPRLEKLLWGRCCG